MLGAEVLLSCITSFVFRQQAGPLFAGSGRCTSVSTVTSWSFMVVERNHTIARPGSRKQNGLDWPVTLCPASCDRFSRAPPRTPERHPRSQASGGHASLAASATIVPHASSTSILVPVLGRQKVLLAAVVDADHHKTTQPTIISAKAAVDAFHPDIDSFIRHTAAAPVLVLAFPLPFQPAYPLWPTGALHLRPHNRF